MDRRIAVLPLALFLTACASLDRDEVAAPAAGGTIAMRDGTALVVSLPPDPATGNGWVLKSAGPNLAFIGGPDYTPDPKPRGLVGEPGMATFRFRARAAGTGTLEFAWVAPPGQPPLPEKTVRYDVTVGPNFPDAVIKTVFGPSGTGQGAVKYWVF